MNKVVLIGRLTKDPELKFTSGSNIPVTSFTLAVDRNFTNASGQREADFISIVCWRKTAELVANNLTKGKLIGLSGSIQVRKYQAQDGSTKYSTEVIADEIKFLEKKEGTSGYTPQNNQTSTDHSNDYLPVGDDSDIPF
jgi:single-strand DNA-binding protein